MITLNLDPQIETKIREEAKSKGLSTEQYRFYQIYYAK
jgi:hypothetical protein